MSLVPQAVSCSELLPLPVAQHLGATGLCPHQLLSKGTSLWGKNIAFRQLLQNNKYLIIYKIIKYLVYFQKLNLIKLDSFLQVLLTFIVIHEVAERTSSELPFHVNCFSEGVIGLHGVRTLRWLRRI